MEQLLSEIRESTVAIESLKADHAQSIEKANVRIDELEAMITRASEMSAGSSGTVAVSDERNSVDFGEFKVLRKSDNLSDFCKKGTGELSLAKTLRGLHFGEWAGAESERDATIHKGQSISPDSSGGFLVPEILSSRVIDLARAQSVVMRAGAGTIPVGGFVTFPRITGDPTLTWRGENSDIPVSEAGVGTYRVSPKTLGVLIPISIELLEDSSPAVEGVLRSLLAAAFAAELDRVMLAGNGTSEPGGILDTPGVTQESSVGSLSYDDLLDAMASVFGSNFSGSYSDLATILNPRTWGALGKAKEATTNAYLKAPDAVAQAQRYQTTNLRIVGSSTDAVVGDFSQLSLALRTGLQIELGRQASPGFAKLQVMLRAYMRCDTVCFRPSHFVALRGITN